MFFFLKCLEILTFIANQGDDGLDVRLFIGLLHHAEPVLQVLEALVVGDVVNQQDALRERRAQLSLQRTAAAAGGSLCFSSALGSAASNWASEETVGGTASLLSTLAQIT